MQVSKIARPLITTVFAVLFAAISASATESVIYTFSPFNQPSQLIQASDGNFYGTAQTGGTSSSGFVFRLTYVGAITVIHNFNGASDGGVPMASLIEGNDGNLYGTTTTGGVGHGTIFRMTLAGALTVLHNFSTTDGTSPGALIENNTGDFFGTARNDGVSHQGSVYEYSHTGVFSILHTFTGTGGDGAIPTNQLLQANDGLIYGATIRGGSLSDGGSVFRFNPAVPASFATFGSFPPTGLSDPNYDPVFGMTQGLDGALYGLTAEGGIWGYGSVYRVVPGAAPTLTLNHANFTGGSDGGLPDSSLTLAGDGNFYGTTSSYGSGGPPRGTIFKVSSGGTVTTLYGFSSPSGQPTGAPIEAADGNFYGPSSGQIYKLVPSSAIARAISLTASPASITLGSSANLAWTVLNAQSDTARNCYAHGSWSGSKGISGSLAITPPATGTYTYALTCGGVESALATVTVLPVPSPTPTPVISPASGTYGGPITYNITDSAPGAVIHYTTNGTVPTLASPVWGGSPLVLLNNTIVEAIAIAPAMTVSSVASAMYGISPTPATACTINYSSGFFSPANLVLNHGATMAASELQMTHGLVNENTSVFTKARVPLKVFATEFQFRFLKATTKSGDGLTFALSAKSPSFYGTIGSGLGFATIPSSMALKFDLTNNAGEGTNSVGVFFNGAPPTVPAVDLTPSGVNLHNGNIMDAYVTYDVNNLTLDLKDTVTGAHFSHTFVLPPSSPIGAPSAYAGFTASSDLSVSNAQILTWKLVSAGPCM